MLIISPQTARVGDSVEFDGKTYIAEAHYSQGKDIKLTDYTHIMFDAKGAFAMREVNG